MADETLETEVTMDGKSLFKEEMFTDRQVGTIQRLTQVDGEGQPVEGGEVVFVGQTQLMTRAGPLPLSFELAASSLSEAAEKFGEGANKAMEDTVKRLEEMRREQSSSIIVPDAGGGAAGGAPGGGQFKMP
ncbi:MAG: hypothetical protein QGH93_07970 [Gammaproteobacteria bacterium]|jgi:hypothetical protein|nr:hypothetical protein [Chromatiales bacterium]MDP6674764.1 hypothetical protein [Gammaproteobacteria bacterium]